MKVFVDALMQYGGLSKFNVPSKLVSFGANGVIMFQGTKTRVTKQLKDKTCFSLVRSSLYGGTSWTQNQKDFEKC